MFAVSCLYIKTLYITHMILHANELHLDSFAWLPSALNILQVDDFAQAA